MDNLNRTSMALNSAMQDGGSMGSALNNLENFTGALNSQSENLAGAIENIHGLTGHIAEADVAGMLARKRPTIQEFVAVNDGRFPSPDAARPILILSFVHL